MTWKPLLLTLALTLSSIGTAGAVVCDDNNACTTDSFADGQCVFTEIDCDDKNPCTVDGCDREIGCFHSRLECDDADACTTDTCDPRFGCVHTNTCLDAFLCYDVKSKSFDEVDGVHLVDQYNDLRYDVTETRELCAPAANTCGCQGECPTPTVADPVTHLRRYKIERSDHHASELLPANVSVTTCLGTVVISTDDDDKIMVPAAKDLSGPPAALDPQSRGVDHFHCYDAVLPKNSKLPKKLQVTLNDQFTGQPKTFDVKGVEHLCVAADKNDEGVQNPAAVLLCYEIKAAKKQPKFVKVKKVWTADQFGLLRQDVVAENEACLPAVIDGGVTTTTIASTTSTSTSTTSTSSSTSTSSTSSSTSTSTSSTSTSTSTTTTSSTSTSTTTTSSTSTTSTTEAMADLSLTKTVSPGTIHTQEPVTFTVTLHNAGPATATGVEVMDLVTDPNLNFSSANADTGNYDDTSGVWSVSTLASGSDATLKIVVSPEGCSTAGFGPHSNTAEVVMADQTDPDSMPANGDTGEDDRATASVIFACD